MEQKYLILDINNVASDCISQTKLINKPSNYIEVENFSMLWHKYENGQWSTESFEPKKPQQQPTLEDKVNYLYYKSMGVI